MASSAKRRQTFAKMQRERLVKERRALKQEKKQAARDAAAAGLLPPTFDDETGEVIEAGAEVETEVETVQAPEASETVR